MVTTTVAMVMRGMEMINILIHSNNISKTDDINNITPQPGPAQSGPKWFMAVLARTCEDTQRAHGGDDDDGNDDGNDADDEDNDKD